MTNKELQAEVERLTAELKSAAETLGATEVELKNCREQRRGLEDQLRLIMEAYNVEPPAGILDTINGLLSAKDADIARLTAELSAYSKWQPSKITAVSTGPVSSEPVPDGQPPMEPDKGDLTPDVVLWRLKHWALIEVKQHYAGREQHLHADLQAALKGGA